jgi:hypothetical protein
MTSNKNPRTEGKIKTHFGMKDYFKYFKKEYPTIDITNKKYYDIIADFNEKICELIINDNVEYNLPNLGSSLCVKKTKKVPKIVDGKLLNTTPVDWVATNKLWNEDEEAKEKKLLVRYSNYHTSKYVFRIYFKKYVYPFKNKKYFKFKSNRTFARLLAKRIKDEEQDKYDAFLLY